MAENTNQSIFIINAQGGYDSIGQEVTKAEYDAWVNENAVTAETPNGNNVSIVGGDDKISVTDGTTTVGYDNVVQPGDGTGVTSYNTAVRQAADDTITNDQALALLQENVTNALALKESIITELNALGRDPETSLTTIDGQQAFTLDAAEAGIDAAYAALYGYKDNLPALIAELQDLALQTIAEYQADVEGGLTVTLPNDLTPFDGRVTSTTVDTTTGNLAKSSITSLSDVATDTTLPTIDEGDTKIQTVEVTANASVSKAIRDSLGLDYQGPIVEKLIDRAINLGLNQIPGYSQVTSAVGTANKIVRLGDIATNVNLSPAETALALARLFIPQVNLLVNGYNLLNGGDGFLGAGGGGGGVEAFDPAPISTTTDPQAGGAGGIGEPPPGDINFSATNVSSADSASAEADAADAEFTGETGTGLRTVAEDQFVETDGGLYVLEDEITPDEIVTDEDTTVTNDPTAYPNGTPYDDEGNLNPGWAINPETGEPYFLGGNYIDPSTIESANASRAAYIQSQTKNAQAQAAISAQRKQANEGDWRVKLRLAGGANYLYRDPELTQDGILWPLNVSDGVVFPYTPQIQTTYGANYNAYDLTHSNYRGYFYQNSYVDEIQIQATFTAQDTSEANYMLAVIHFFKSVTKMFYGQDAQRGMPPPLVFLQGLGEFQFNLHPCVVKTFNYQLPNNVDYIRARSVSVDGTNLLKRRDRQTLSTSSSLLQIQRLLGAGLQTGALTTPQAPPTLGTNNPTYVPTKIDISLGLLPIQSRSQVSKQFSVKEFANGDLLKGGFW